MLKYFFKVVILELIYNNELLLIGISGVDGLIICFFFIKKFKYFCLILLVFIFFINKNFFLYVFVIVVR